MRVWTVSDLHIDYAENAEFVRSISIGPFLDDILIVPGDLTHDFTMLKEYLILLKDRFAQVLFLPGNHDIWIHNDDYKDSIEKFNAILKFCKQEGIETKYTTSDVSIIPFYGWYDFSFGHPNEQIQRAWRDFKRCRWPFPFEDVNLYFLKLNESWCSDSIIPSKIKISYSHFLPFAKLVPSGVPPIVRSLIPVMGSISLGEQIKQFQPNLHIYGHSHLNRKAFVDGIRCLNNAYAYPREKYIARKRMICVYDQELLT